MRASELHQYETLAVVLPGGAALTAFEAGALAALVQLPGWLKRVRVVCGVSGGALAGAMLALAAARQDPAPIHRLEEVWESTTPAELSGLPDWLPLSGMLSVAARAVQTLGGSKANPVAEKVRQALKPKDWQALARAARRKKNSVQLGVVITSASTGCGRLVTTAEGHCASTLERALVASAAIPGIFPAVRVFARSRELWVDGCLVGSNPTGWLSSFPGMSGVQAVLVIANQPVGLRAESTNARSVGERLLTKIGVTRPQAAPAVPVLQLGPQQPLPFGPLDFDPQHLHEGLRLGRAAVHHALAS